MQINRINTGQRLSPSTRKIIKLRERAFRNGGASLELQTPTNYIRDISRDLNHDITKEVVRRNVLNWSEDYGNVYWSKPNLTLTANTTIAPNGSNTAYKISETNTNTAHFISNPASSIVSNTYTLSIYAKKLERDWIGVYIYNGTTPNTHVAYFNLNTGAIGTIVNTTASITNVGNGWFRCSITANVTAVTNANAGYFVTLADNTITYLGNGTSGIYVWGSQLEIGSTLTSYQPTQTSNTDAGASLIMTPNTMGEGRLFNCKPELRNNITYSEDFTNAIWQKGNSTISSNVTPNPVDGLSTASSLIETAVSGSHTIQANIAPRIIKNRPYTFSIFLKRNQRSGVSIQFSDFVANATGGGRLDLLNGTIAVNFTSGTGFTVLSQNLINQGNGWYRLVLTINFNSPNPNIIFILYMLNGTNGNYLGDGTSGIYMYGAQLEEGTTATPYQRTTDGISDFQATRATTATVVRKDGSVGDGSYNLLQFSEDYTNSAWLKISTTVTSNATISPIMVNNATKLVATTANAFHSIRQGIAMRNTYFTFSVYVKGGEIKKTAIQLSDSAVDAVTFTVDLANKTYFQSTSGGTIFSNSTFSLKTLPNDWVLCTLTSLRSDLGSTSTYAYIYVDDISFIGNNNDGIYIWGAQLTQGSIPKDYLKTTNRLNVPSIDYGLGSNNPTLLVEPQRTNLLTFSDDFTNGTWIKTNTTIAPNATIAPNLTLTADKLIDSATNAIHTLWKTFNTTSGTTYTNSIYVGKYTGAANTNRYVSVGMADGASAYYVNVDLQTGLVTATNFLVGGANPLANMSHVVSNVSGFYRIQVTATINKTVTTGYAVTQNSNSATPVWDAASNIPYLGNGVSGVFIWGAQLEVGSNPTSYIPTTSGQATRNRYTSYVDLFNDNLLNKDNFTLYVEGFNYLGTTPNGSVIFANASGGGIFQNDTLGFYSNIRGTYYTGSVWSPIGTDLPANTYYKFVIQRNGNQVKFFRNGVQLGTTQTVPVFDYRYLTISSDTNGSTYSIQKLALWKHTKTDAECATLSDMGGLLTNLVGHYALDNNINETTGTLPSATSNVTNYVDGKFGKAAQFTSTFIDIPDSDNLSFTEGGGVDLPFSISMWVYFTAFSSTGNWLINKRNNIGGDEWQFVRSGATSRLSFIKFSNSSSNFQGIQSTTPLSLNTWYHLVITDNGTKTNSGMKIYVDGVDTTVVNNNSGVYSGMNNGTSKTTIGLPSWTPPPAGANHQGYIDDISIWKNRALTLSEVNQIYNSGTGKTYPFN